MAARGLITNIQLLLLMVATLAIVALTSCGDGSSEAPPREEASKEDLDGKVVSVGPVVESAPVRLEGRGEKEWRAADNAADDGWSSEMVSEQISGEWKKLVKPYETWSAY